MSRQETGLQYADVPPERWDRLWREVAPDEPPHAVEPGELGEFATLVRQQGLSAAVRAFPNVAGHLGLDDPAALDGQPAELTDPATLAGYVRARCPACAADLQELLAFLDEDEPPAMLAAAALPGAIYVPPAAAPPARRARVGPVVVAAAAGVLALGAGALLALSAAGHHGPAASQRATPAAVATVATPGTVVSTAAPAIASPAGSPSGQPGQVGQVAQAVPTTAAAAASTVPTVTGLTQGSQLPPASGLAYRYIQNFDPRVHIYSGPCRCPTDPVDFGVAGPQFTTFTVAGPQVGDRILVYNPITNNYGWIDAPAVGPSGPPA